MRIHKNIEIRDLGLYLVQEKILILSDLHIGQEESIHRQGIMVPLFQFEDLKKRISSMLADVDTVVLNGDVKHEFGRIMQSEWQQTKELLELFSGKKIIIIKGNHDTIITPLLKDVALMHSYSVGDILICHGDDILDVKNKVIIIGHEHTAIGLKEGSRIEKYKCFLKGKWKSNILITMPACNPLTIGTDVLREPRLSPYLQHNLDDFEAYIVSDKVYDFGKIKNLL